MAILGVTLYHLRVPFTTGGFLGVDIFFVLSGFLITSILLDEWNKSNRIGMRNFYWRRVLRLGPALFITIGLTTVCAIHDHMVGRWLYLGIISTTFYFSNWIRAFHWNADALGLLGHTWSLSVEEQFYLLWPAILLQLLRKRFRRVLILAALALAFVASAGGRAMLWRTGHPFLRVYCGLDTRADALLAGCISALLPGRSLSRAWMLSIQAAGVLAAGFLLAHLTLFDITKGLNYLFGYGEALIALATAILIAALTRCRLPGVSWALSSMPLRWLGRISYGLYLYQILVMNGPPHRLIDRIALHAGVLAGPTAVIAKLLCLFTLAAVSFQFFERPFLKLKNHFEPRPSPTSTGSPS